MSLSWQFPLPRAYTGILLGNGRMGIMVWGADDVRLTIARNGFWDRRGGVPFSSRTTYKTLRGILEAGDQEALRGVFSSNRQHTPYRTPTQLPGGRMDLRFSSRPSRADLDVRNGCLTVFLEDGGTVGVRLSMTRDLVVVEGDPEGLELTPSWAWIGETLSAGGVERPEEWRTDCGGGFVQRLPEDPAFAAEWARRPGGLVLATAVSEDPAADTSALLAGFNRLDNDRETDEWWEDYYDDAPRVVLPDEAMQRVWDYGLFKQAGLTPPHGIAATLQGAWMAEDAFPPWSNDYHFNINLQMIYWPALPTNRADHFLPVWNLLERWLPALRDNAAGFFGSSEALMLPHAVDDSCQVIGHYWQGTIDQACTAWMAQLAWLHYRHTMDEATLSGVAWPLLLGAFEGFWAMAEEFDGRLSLPVSVSAEYPGWGRDASFQLAAFHMVADLLQRAADALGRPRDPRWQEVRTKLPMATTMPLAKVWGESEPRPRIVIWEGQDLDESHRHHSHLAAISPFHMMDPLRETEARDLVRRSIEHWAAMGPGRWAGWSVPWAAMIWARCNYASASVTLLRVWEDVFTNSGGQTLHDADSPGFSSWIHGPFFDWPETTRQTDKMQMDAAMGALQAICEIFVQQRGDVLHVLPSLPKQWKEFSFEGILCEGAFLVSATVSGGVLRSVRIISQKGGALRVAFPSSLRRGDQVASSFELLTAPGETMDFLHG